MYSMQDKNRNKSRKEALSLILGIVVLWQLCAVTGIWSSYILPSPTKVARCFVAMLKSGELLIGVLISGRRVILGVVSAVGLTILLESLGFASSAAQRIIRKAVRFLQNVPPLSMIPLLILWFGIGERTKVIFITLGCFAPIMINFHKGLHGCDKDLLEVGQCYQFSNREMLRLIILPSAEHDILTGIRVGFSYAWKSVVGAEMIAATSGIGYMIRDAQFMARTDKILVGIIVMGTIGFAVDSLLTGWISKRQHRGGDPVGWN